MVKWFGYEITNNNSLSESCYLECIPNEYIETVMIRLMKKRIAPLIKKGNYILI